MAQSSRCFFRLVHALALVGLFACGPSEEKKTLTLGAMVSVTGELSSDEGQILFSARLAIDEINAAGGVLGYQLDLVNHDDRSDEGHAAVVADELLEKKYPIVFGGNGSGVTLAAATKLAPAQVVQISPAATSPVLTTFEDDGYFFRTVPSDAFASKLMSKRAKDKGYTKMSILFAPGAYGEGMAAAFKESFEAGGGTISSYIEIEEGKGSYTDELALTLADSPQAVLLVVYESDGVQIIKDYNLNPSFSGKNVAWFFSDSLAGDNFIAEVGPSNFSFAHEGAYQSIPTGPRYERFAKAYLDKYGSEVAPYSYGAQMYDAVYLAALALAKAGKVEGPAIRDAMIEISRGGKEYGADEFKAAVEALQAGDDINYEGASGSADMDDHGDTLAAYDVWKVEGGAITPIETNVMP